MFFANPGKTLVGSLFCVTALLSGCSDALDPLNPSQNLEPRFGANSGAPGKTCSSISVSLSPSSIVAGQTAQATAAIKANNGKTTGGSVTWSSSSPSVATVSSNGTVSALTAGTSSITATTSGCNGSAIATVTSTPATTSVTAVAVSFNDATLAPGEKAQASAKATDANGKVVFGETVSWRSLNTAIAIVSSTGEVTALSAGSAMIEGTVQTVASSSAMTVASAVTSPTIPPPDGIARPADMINASFDDGTLGGFGTWGATRVDVVNDPTGSGRGNIARLRYVGSNGDDNTSLIYQPKVGFGRSIFFRGEFYIPVSDNMTDQNVQRKLLYFKQHEDWGKYSFGGHKFRTFIKLTGDELGIDAVYEPTDLSQIDAVRTYGAIAYGMKPRTWYTLEVQQTTESSIGAKNGILRIWLDGKMIFEKTSMSWSDPTWTKDQAVEDIYWDTFMIGQQVNIFGASFDEYRYWNNVAFSSQRIGQ
jgi:uncharacterized protein YjdB